MGYDKTFLSSALVADDKNVFHILNYKNGFTFKKIKKKTYNINMVI